MENEKILYIDDEPINLENFTRLLGREYCIFTATSGEEALKILEREGEMALVISDQRMPGFSGVEILAQVKEMFPDSVRIMLTAYSDTEYLLASINQGHVARYLMKPWDEYELRIAIKQAVQTYFLTRRNKELLRDLNEKKLALEKMNLELEAKVAERTRSLEDTNTILSWANEHLNLANYERMLKTDELRLANETLQTKIEELEKSRDEVKILHGLLPICSYCKKIRNDDQYWEEIETFMTNRSEMLFSHGICPGCYETKVLPDMDNFIKESRKEKEEKEKEKREQEKLEQENIEIPKQESDFKVMGG